MTRKALGGIITSVISLVVACAAGGTLLVGGGAASGCMTALPNGAVSVSAPAGGWRPVGRFDAEEVGHAGTIAAVGAQMGVHAKHEPDVTLLVNSVSGISGASGAPPINCRSSATIRTTRATRRPH